MTVGGLDAFLISRGRRAFPGLYLGCVFIVPIMEGYRDGIGIDIKLKRVLDS